MVKEDKDWCKMDEEKCIMHQLWIKANVLQNPNFLKNGSTGGCGNKWFSLKMTHCCFCLVDCK